MLIWKFLAKCGLIKTRREGVQLTNMSRVYVNSSEVNFNYELIPGDKVKVFNKEKECIFEKDY